MNYFHSLDLVAFYAQCKRNPMLPNSYMTSIYDEVLQYLKQLDATTLQALNRLFRYERHPANTILQHANDTITKLWLIRKGILCCKMDHPTRELIYCFHFEGELIGHYFNYLRGSTNETSLETITDIEAWSVNIEALLALHYHDRALDRLFDCFIAAKHEWIENFTLKKEKMHAEELYVSLMNDHPLYFKLLPLHLIAAYMGITPNSLSRILG